MLEFIESEHSGNLIADSEVTPFKSYCIVDGAWCHLSIAIGDRAGVKEYQKGAFNTVEDAIAEANRLDSYEGNDNG